MASAYEQVLQEYEPVIGLEVHAQLKTKSKIFSRASAAFNLDNPNTNIEAYCIGLPGVLPVLNENVVRMAIRTGLALSCEVRTTSIWARKHYFYPDLPKGYQISQYNEPVCEHGHLGITDDDGSAKSVSIVRIHMEEDAGKNVHVDGADYSVVDFNRAGVPLLEIVSGPDLRSPTEAGRYLKALRAILMTLDVCDGSMQEGSFRCDANVSIRKRGATEFGTRCEIKNLNSFKFVEQAIEHEVVRHARLVQDGKRIVQETRLFDSHKKTTRSMRSKEDAHDYRYFPDPDLPPLVFPQAWIKEAEASLPELPRAKLERYLGLELDEDTARTFSEERDLSAFVDQCIEHYPEGARGIANLVKTEILRELKDEPGGIREAKVSPKTLADLIRAKDKGEISARQQKKILLEIWNTGAALSNLLKKEGGQVSDASVLEPIVDELIAKHTKEVEKYRSGEKKIISFFMGQVMKATKGKANPKLVKELLEKKLEE